MILQYLRQTGGNYLEILTTERLAASDTVFIDLYDHSWGEIEQNGPALVCMSLITREAIGSALVYLFIFGFPFAAVQISVNQLRWHFPAIRSKLPPGLLSFFFPRETVEGSLHLLPKYRFCQRTTPARDKDISLKERTDSSASFRSIEWLIVAKSFISPELACRH